MTITPTTGAKKPPRAERKLQRRDDAIARQRALLKQGFYRKLVIVNGHCLGYDLVMPAPLSQFDGRNY